jgi:two-component system OmpR family sensor kinase
MSLLANRHFELGAVPAGILKADPDRLTQALRNLLSNAIAHTTPGEGLVRLEAQREGTDRLKFAIEDDGPGIPVDQRERVFDRFHRTDAARDRTSGGSGLGLAIVRAIAEAHEGHVAVGHPPEQGTRIELELPHFTAQRREKTTSPEPDRRAGEIDIKDPSSPGCQPTLLAAHTHQDKR